MNRRAIFLWLFAAMPVLLSAQETKLVNCRTLEAAGNFVGPDEVVDGDKVCQKLKPGAAPPAKLEAPKPLPGAMISNDESMNIVEAAKAKGKRVAGAKDAAVAEPAAAPEPAAPPEPAVEPAKIEEKPGAPEERAPVSVPVPEAPARPESKPEMAVPAKPPASERVAAPEPVREATPPAAPVQPAPAPVSAAAAPVAAPAVSVRRDAPVAAGTPAAPPEKDPGFSDANAVDTPAASPAVDAVPANAATTTRSGDQNAAHTVQLGAFEKPREVAAGETPEMHNTNLLPGDTEGLQEGQRAECTKNITLGSLRAEKLVLGTPRWAKKWIEKNQKRMPNVCFSDTPMKGARNYLIVFYTAPENQVGANATMPTPDLTPAEGVGAFTTKYGSTWHYAVDRNVGVTVLTHDEADEPHSQGQVWYATAYTEEGMPMAERWPEQPKHAAKSEEKNPKERPRCT